MKYMISESGRDVRLYECDSLLTATLICWLAFPLQILFLCFLTRQKFHSMTKAVNIRSHLGSTLLVFSPLFLNFKMLLKQVRP